MTDVVFSEHSADRLRALAASDKQAVADLLEALKSGRLTEGPSVHRLRPYGDDVYALRSGGLRVIYTVQDDKTPPGVYVIAILSAREPEGSDEELIEVVTSAAASG